MNTSKLIIRDLELTMSIGVLDHEKQSKQCVIVNVEILLKEAPDISGDNIDDVLSYNDIVQAIKDISNDRHIHLVETFADEIAAKILAHEQADHCTVRVEKPDIYDDVGSVGIEITR
ncbi:MAG: dihydroneopterin aldolase [Pseudomonadota bacterium]